MLGVKGQVAEALTEAASLALGPAAKEMRRIIAASLMSPEQRTYLVRELNELNRKLDKVGKLTPEEQTRYNELKALLDYSNLSAAEQKRTFESIKKDLILGANQLTATYSDLTSGFIGFSASANQGSNLEDIFGAPAIPASTARAEEGARVLAAPASGALPTRTEMKIDETLEIRIQDEAEYKLKGLDEMNVNFFAARLAEVQEKMKHRRESILGRYCKI